MLKLKSKEGQRPSESGHKYPVEYRFNQYAGAHLLGSWILVFNALDNIWKLHSWHSTNKGSAPDATFSLSPKDAVRLLKELEYGA